MIAPTNRLLCIATVVVVPACAIVGVRPTLLPEVTVLLVAFACLSAWDARSAWLPAAEMATTASAATYKWFKNRPASLQIELSNVRSRGELALELPPGLAAPTPVVEVSNSPRQSIDIAIHPEERGRYQITTCHVRARSRWQLWHVTARKRLDIRVQVFPDLVHEPGAKILFRQQRSGPRRQQPIGRGREFERLREYTHSDSFDEISWKATARRRRPVVKVFQVERTQDVYVAVDDSYRSARSGNGERFVKAALMVALATETEGDNFGLVIFNREVTHFVPAAHGKTHFARCRDAIFDLQPQRTAPDFEELFTFLQLRIRRRALLLFLTNLEDPIAAESFARGAHLLARKHLVVVANVETAATRPLFTGELPQSVPEIHDRLAGHLQWAATRENSRRLQQSGVLTRTLRASVAGLDLVEQYADIKRRQLL